MTEAEPPYAEAEPSYMGLSLAEPLCVSAKPSCMSSPLVSRSWFSSLQPAYVFWSSLWCFCDPVMENFCDPVTESRYRSFCASDSSNMAVSTLIWGVASQ